MSKKRITKVYTKTGDLGETSLVGGRRVSKSSLRVDSYGEVDELNSVLGIVQSIVNDGEIKELIESIQNGLFIMGGDLATPDNSEIGVPRIDSEMIEKFESLIDKYVREVGDLKEFILPGGSEPSSFLHLARTICRRAERKIVALNQEEKINSNLIIYINRLSDLLFMLARVINKRCDIEETYVDFSEK